MGIQLSTGVVMELRIAAGLMSGDGGDHQSSSSQRARSPVHWLLWWTASVSQCNHLYLLVQRGYVDVGSCPSGFMTLIPGVFGTLSFHRMFKIESFSRQPQKVSLTFCPRPHHTRALYLVQPFIFVVNITLIYFCP